MRGLNRLAARQVATLGEGYHADGGGLYLQVRGSARSWIYRYQLNKRRREMGLGPATAVSLLEARQAAQEARRTLAKGLDPITHRRAARAHIDRLWGEAVDDLIAALSSEWKTDAQAHQWTQSLRDYGPDRGLPVRLVDTAVVMKCLGPLWTEKTETATRVRGRIERVWDAERVRGTVAGENPARWKGHLAALLPKPSKVHKVKHHEAMPYEDVPAFMARLMERDCITRLALRFTILTAARTAEVRGAPWSEFEGDLWTIPDWRIKGGKMQRVPLPRQALAILEGLPRDRPPFRLSSNTMLNLVQKPPPKGFGLPYTVHGFRSSFRDWGAETTAFPRELLEKALAHTLEDKTEAAYQRGDLLEKRRQLMQVWADFVCPE